MVNEEGELLWGTIDGRQIPFSEVTHQHWSNIYWYHRHLFESATEGLYENAYGVLTDYAEKTQAKCKHLMEVALNQIEKRFDGEILDWQPKYENEIAWYKKQSTRKILLEFIR
jgi:hypothetical protein